MTFSPFPWSFSSLKTFEQCPKKYFHLKVAGDVKDTPGEAAMYGSEVHKAAEEYLRDGKEIPKKYDYMVPVVDPFMQMRGDKYAEYELGVRRDGDDYSPCEFTDPDAYYRGIADVLVVNGKTATCVDYKTGKSSRYADMRQLDLLAGGVFVHFPEVQTVNSALIFVVAGELIPKVHKRSKMRTYLQVMDPHVERLEQAVDSGVWNPKDGPLCGWCPVKDCAHWRPPRR